jgi:hypothetical protein
MMLAAARAALAEFSLIDTAPTRCADTKGAKWGDFNKRISAYAKHRQTADFSNVVATQFRHRMCSPRSVANACFH